MNVQKYKAFIKTIESGSFTKAADVLGYSQSGVSRMIGDLEREWNVVLLERNKTGLRLTSDGLKILPYAKKLCEEYDKMVMQIDSIHGLEKGLIRIGTFSSVATHWLPNIIKAFQEDYPGIEYELLVGDYSEIEEWIVEGRVDAGFLRLPVREGLDAMVLERDELKAIIPANHPLADVEHFPLEALCDEPFMLLERSAKSEVSELFEKHGLIPNVRFTTWDDYAVMSMVESGLGVGVLPNLILKRIPYDIVCKSLDVEAYREICFVVRDMKTTSIAVKRFMEYLDYRDK